MASAGRDKIALLESIWICRKLRDEIRLHPGRDKIASGLDQIASTSLIFWQRCWLTFTPAGWRTGRLRHRDLEGGGEEGVTKGDDAAKSSASVQWWKR